MTATFKPFVPIPETAQRCVVVDDAGLKYRGIDVGGRVYDELAYRLAGTSAAPVPAHHPIERGDR